MIVHCRNQSCKPKNECRKPAHTFGEALSNAQLRTGREVPSCARCKSTFVEKAAQKCYKCEADNVPPPYTLVNTIQCVECKELPCRHLKDFVAKTPAEEDEECPVCCEAGFAIKVRERGFACVRACALSHPRPRCFLLPLRIVLRHPSLPPAHHCDNADV
jgi:hypothetical protein